ncbi:NAD(P)H-quinone oxidoreductase subunit J, chloroplastic [Myxococcus stipitatus]
MTPPFGGPYKAADSSPSVIGAPLSTFALDRVSAHFPEAVVERYVDRAGGAWAVIHADSLPKVAAFLKNDAELEFKLFGSMDGVDRLHLAENDPRFEVIYILYSLKRREHVRFKVRVSEHKLVVPSLVPVFRGANWWERLTFDFYGIRFDGHPDLRRILLYEEFQGHPLRKDYALRDRQPLIPERPIKDIFRGPGTSGHS